MRERGSEREGGREGVVCGFVRELELVSCVLLSKNLLEAGEVALYHLYEVVALT